MCWLHLLKDKFDVEQTLKNFHNMVKTQFSTHIQIPNTNNGKEYCNQILVSYLSENDIIYQCTCSNTP